MDLLYTWTTGGVRVRHAGFGVCPVKRTDKPLTIRAKYRTAEQAVAAAEALGPGYAAFRLVDRKGRVQPKEMLTRAELPISLSVT